MELARKVVKMSLIFSTLQAAAYLTRRLHTEAAFLLKTTPNYYVRNPTSIFFMCLKQWLKYYTKEHYK